jgi:hypothetical protein
MIDIDEQVFTIEGVDLDATVPCETGFCQKNPRAAEWYHRLVVCCDYKAPRAVMLFCQECHDRLLSEPGLQCRGCYKVFRPAASAYTVIRRL